MQCPACCGTCYLSPFSIENTVFTQTDTMAAILILALVSCSYCFKVTLFYVEWTECAWTRLLTLGCQNRSEESYVAFQKPLVLVVRAHTWCCATHGNVPKLRQRRLCLSTLLSRNPWCTYTQCIATHNREERQKLASSRKWAFHWHVFWKEQVVVVKIEISSNCHICRTCTSKWSQFIDVNWLVNTRCVLTGHIANHWVMAATSGGTGFAESLQHWIGHQSSAPSVYGRLTASIYERHWALSSKTVLQSFCNILYHPSSIQVCTSPSTVLLVSFSDCLNEIIMRLVIKLE